MKVVKCVNGHFFDSDTYEICPHCGETAINEPVKQKPVVKAARRGFNWGRSKEKTAEPVVYQEPVVHFQSDQADDPEKPPANTASSQETALAEPAQVYISGQDKTLDFWQTGSPPLESITDDLASIEQPLDSQSPAIFKENPPAASLEEVVRQASANSDSKTMSYFSAAVEETSGIEITLDPVVGWLVCIGGKHFGESFSISAGKNSIGRNIENKIVLQKDKSVSRHKHALIVYEPKKRNFYLQPGDSSGLTYLNDTYITEAKRINRQDIIEIGDSKFFFVPLCDESFSWDNFMAKE